MISAAEERFTLVLRRASLTGVLLGGAGTVYFLAGLAGYVTSLLPNFFVAAALAGALLFFFREFFTLRDTAAVGRSLWTATFFFVILVVLLALAPPPARDQPTHHLTMLRLYVRAGRIIETPAAPSSYYPMLLDMLYAPWLVWGYDWAPKLVHALFGYLTGLLIYAYLARRMNSVYGSLGFLFWISTPAVLRSSLWGYVELAIVFFTTAAVLCLLRWREDRQHASWLVLAGLAAGFACATHPDGWVACLLIFLLLAWQFTRAPKRRFSTTISELALFAVAVALPGLPWLAKNLYQTGNPFFPLLSDLFGANGAAAGAPGLDFSLTVSITKRELLFGKNGWDSVTLPLSLFFSGTDDKPQYFAGVLSPLLILLLPWAFKGKWFEEKRWLLVFAILYLACFLLLVDLPARSVLLIVPPLVILAVYAVFNIYLRLKQPAYLLALLLILTGYHGYFAYRYFCAVALPLLGNE